MDAIEQRARELLAAEFETADWPVAAERLRAALPTSSIVMWEKMKRVSLNAIIAGLTPPEGYVLVPVEPTVEMLGEIQLVEHFTGNALRARYAAMLAARPEVPGA
ncbi:hypothetical protein C1925_04910 [Stenotrophomonas sp. SAU14A_NAIMI4_5]|uniref:hypothetical protein n=1 Tax=Stenotrophomonas sp. SAU14A_NAIMI4_5 TaxID=2072413 RepID=UPI000D53CF0D|nr:hypothetical protein [Stenotrophomonas sp. SAU14A_NAIMI4_5]AWH48544.1 hypothetical protein C1925_04910 [Stenotrophomonas sp. SAU14A_NAIMI4_5]